MNWAVLFNSRPSPITDVFSLPLKLCDYVGISKRPIECLCTILISHWVWQQWAQSCQWQYVRIFCQRKIFHDFEELDNSNHYCVQTRVSKGQFQSLKYLNGYSDFSQLSHEMRLWFLWAKIPALPSGNPRRNPCEM